MEIRPPDRSRRGIAVAGVPHSNLFALVAGALVVAALYLGRDLFVPLVLAVLMAFVLAPLAGLLGRLGLPRVAAVLLAVLAGVGVIVALAVMVVRQVAALAGDLPRYASVMGAKLEALRLDELVAQAEAGLKGITDIFSRGVDPFRPPAPAPVAPGASPLDVLAHVAEPVLEPLATAGIVVVFALFILLYREDLRDRLIRLAGARDLHRTMGAMDDAAHRLSRLFLSQLTLNAAFGVVIAAVLWVLGLPGALLWGLLAGLMRFVPFVGTFIAVVPPVILALAADPGWGLAIAVLVLFLVSEPLMGQLAEPLIFGRSTGLSPLSVILAATFWTFMWGPIGLLLATPLTVLLVVLGRHVPQLEFLDVMLGNKPPLAPEESFYQRALEGDADALVAQARTHLREGGSLVAWHDEVALRGLALAEADWSREVLEPERLDVVRAQVEALLDELAETPRAESESQLPAAWREPGAVLCVPGRGRLDDLAAAVAAQALAQAGFGATPIPRGVLEGEPDPRLDPARVRLCCLSVLEEGSSATAARYFLRRLRRQVPGVQVVLGLWHAPADSPMLAELRAQGGAPGGAADSIVTSVREVIALCQAEATAEAAPPAPAPAPAPTSPGAADAPAGPRGAAA
ncbi:AI-2E family transporter [Falsiroseomonas sp. CW058]|uniref:AI-2E family transporter n=1 Tax=Falsiroseomonas sp. CW058 TaxID=3388664 RepID=UPI003D31C0A4